MLATRACADIQPALTMLAQANRLASAIGYALLRRRARYQQQRGKNYRQQHAHLSCETWTGQQSYKRTTCNEASTPRVDLRRINSAIRNTSTGETCRNTHSRQALAARPRQKAAATPSARYSTLGRRRSGTAQGEMRGLSKAGHRHVPQRTGRPFVDNRRPAGTLNRAAPDRSNLCCMPPERRCPARNIPPPGIAARRTKQTTLAHRPPLRPKRNLQCAVVRRA